MVLQVVPQRWCTKKAVLKKGEKNLVLLFYAPSPLVDMNRTDALDEDIAHFRVKRQFDARHLLISF